MKYRLKYWRERRFLTIRELAEKADVAPHIRMPAVDDTADTFTLGGAVYQKSTWASVAHQSIDLRLFESWLATLPLRSLHLNKIQFQDDHGEKLRIYRRGASRRIVAIY